MTPPRLSSAKIDWHAALHAVASHEVLRPAALAAKPRSARAGLKQKLPKVLAQLNALVGPRFPEIAKSPVPVLLPFDTGAFLNDHALGAAGDPNELSPRYMSGFHARTFFFPGPSGYDAAFAVRPADVPDLADISFPEPFQVHISGSSLLYELDDAVVATGAPVPDLEADFPGIRRLIHEHHLRYTFVRFGVPYVVSIGCSEAGVRLYRFPSCKAADRVALRFVKALRVVGGMPQPQRTIESPPIERPQEASPSFSFEQPGRLLPGTGFARRDGKADSTVYSQIRFPLAEAPAFVNSQMFQARNKPRAAGHLPNYAYPWRDNFCERRGFVVGQCPAGLGHQGQDIRPALCEPAAGQDRCPPHDLVAVRDGAIMRSPKQEAVYLVVNTAHEHLRFRYLHMNPRKMDADELLSGRLVHEGEIIAHMSNFHRREGGTSYHLHFDVQVPTRHGWVFVNPYMTLVAAYERLIGARGEQLSEPVLVASADPTATASVGKPTRLERPSAKPSKSAKRKGYERKAQKGRSAQKARKATSKAAYRPSKSAAYRPGKSKAAKSKAAKSKPPKNRRSASR